MKTMKIIFILIFTLSFSHINAQSEKDQEKEDYKVSLFSDAEFANLHIWFYNETQKMNLSEKVDNEYSSIRSMYFFRMSRLNDKDKGYSTEEIIEGLYEIFDKLNVAVKPVLTEDQFSQHLELMKGVSKAILNKMKLEE